MKKGRNKRKPPNFISVRLVDFPFILLTTVGSRSVYNRGLLEYSSLLKQMAGYISQ